MSGTAMNTTDAEEHGGGPKWVPWWRRWWFVLAVTVVAGLVLSSFVDTGPVATVAALLLGVVIFPVRLVLPASPSRPRRRSRRTPGRSGRSSWCTAARRAGQRCG